MKNRIVTSLCSCSGVEAEAIAKSPSSRKEAAIQGLLFVIAAMISSATSGYAAHQIFLGAAWAIAMALLGGLLWGTLVFCIDQRMVQTMDKFSSPWRQLLLRAPLALLVSMVMSKPFLLHVAEPILEKELRVERMQAIQKETAVNSRELNDQKSDVLKLADLKQQLSQKKNLEPDSFQYRQAKAAQAAAETELRNTQAAKGLRISAARSELSLLQGITSGSDFEAGLAEARIAELTDQIGRDQREIQTASAAAQNARNATAKATQQWNDEIEPDLQRTLADLEKAETAVDKAGSRVAVVNEEAARDIQRLTAPNFVNQYTTLRKITNNPAHPDSGTLRAFEWGFDLLFIVIELVPLMMKAFGKVSPLDHAVAALHFEEESRINGEANAKVDRMQRVAEAVSKIDTGAVEAWQDGHIENLKGKTLSTAELKKLREELASA